MSTKVVSIKLDENLKEAAQEVAKSAGLTLSALVNSYLHQVVATRHIDIYVPEPVTPHLEKLIAEVEAEIERGEVSEGYDNAADFVAALKKK